MHTNLEPPLLTGRILIFSDLNCPYCFTLNEWLMDLGLQDRFRWVGIEHRPDLPLSGANLEADRLQLVREVEDVQRRAPEVGVLVPPVWCNSQDALLLMNAVEVDDPVAAPLLRQRLYRRYWCEGSLLSDRAQLEQEAKAFADLAPEEERSELARLTGWWRQHLDRIPAMLAPTGLAHLGLQDRGSVTSFVQSAIASTTPGPGCR